MAVDKALCRQSEQERAFLRLITGVEGELCGAVRQQVKSGHVAQDIVQRTFLLAWRDAKFDATHVYARAWLFKTARRLVSEWFASAENSSISLEDLSERERRDGSRGSRSALPVDRRDGDSLTKLIDAEQNRSLALALSRLEEDDREVIERYYLRQEGTQIEIVDSCLRCQEAELRVRLAVDREPDASHATEAGASGDGTSGRADSQFRPQGKAFTSLLAGAGLDSVVETQLTAADPSCGETRSSVMDAGWDAGLTEKFTGSFHGGTSLREDSAGERSGLPDRLGDYVVIQRVGAGQPASGA